MKAIWDVNAIQFPRLLAEIRATGLTSEQYTDLCDSMDLTPVEIDDLLERAEDEWEALKDAVQANLGNHADAKERTETVSTPEDLEHLRRMHEELKLLPRACVAAVAKQALDLLDMSDTVTMADLDAVTDEDPALDGR